METTISEEVKATPENHAEKRPLKDVSDFLLTLEDLIGMVQDGSITESKANVILKGRALQLRTVELNLRYQRQNQWKKGDLPMLRARDSDNGDGTK